METMYYPTNANCSKKTHGMNIIMYHSIHLLLQRINTFEP